MTPDGINVNEIAPATPELYEVARRRCDEIVRAWAHRIATFGTTDELHGPKPLPVQFSIAELAVAAYVQGVRDTAAVAARGGGEGDNGER